MTLASCRRRLFLRLSLTQLILHHRLRLRLFPPLRPQSLLLLVNPQYRSEQFLRVHPHLCLLRHLPLQHHPRSVRKHLGWDVLLNGYGGGNQHLSVGGVRVYGYDVATQSEHAHDRHARQKSHGTPKYGGVHYLKVHSGYGARLAFDAHAAEDVSNGRDDSEEPTHANSAHPSDELHHADRRYGDDDNVRHDANDCPRSALPCLHQHEV